MKALLVVHSSFTLVRHLWDTQLTVLPNVEREPREAAAIGSELQRDRDAAFPSAPRSGSNF